MFDFRFTRHPPVTWVLALAASIYLNFFTHHFVPDMRIALFGMSAVLFAHTRVHYRIWRRHRWMPLLVGLVLVALFIWLAENIGTFAHAWIYPHQQNRAWTPVGTAKIGSWYLLMLISYALVAIVHGTREMTPAVASPGREATVPQPPFSR